MEPEEKIAIENIDNLIKANKAFIIKTTANTIGRYVQVENDEAFSIALSAFAESVEKYDENRGNFFSFARLVMESRLKTFLIKENKQVKAQSIEDLGDEGIEIPDPMSRERNDLCDEIDLYREELLKFGLTLEKLATVAPKHRDARENAKEIGAIAGRDKPTVELTYKKKKLPIRAVAKVARATERVVQRNKTFILGTLIVFANELTQLINFISGDEEEK